MAVTDKDIVIKLYRTFMERQPENEEIAYWAEELESGKQSVCDLIDLFGYSEMFEHIETYVRG